MAKTSIVLLFAALFVFNAAAYSLRRPETVKFSDEFSDDFFAGFGGGGARPSFGGGRPSMGSMPRPPMNIRPPVSMPRPPVSMPRPPVSMPRPPVNIPRPPVNVPRPPVNVPRPPVNIPRPPVNTPRPPVNIPKPPVNIPKPPVAVPKPPVNIPKPPVNVPKPPVVVPKPPVNIPKPPVNTPKPTPPVVNTPKPTPPVVNTPKPTPPVVTPKPTTPVVNTPKPGTQVNAQVNVNNGQISGQAGVTKTSGTTTVAGKVTLDQGKVGAQGSITKTIQNGKVEGTAKLGNGAKPEVTVSGQKTIGSTTVTGQAGLTDGKLGVQGTVTKNIQNGQIQGSAKLGNGAKPEVTVSGQKTIGSTTVTGQAGLADGKLGAQGTITKNIQGGQIEGGLKVGYGAKPEAYIGGTKTVGPDAINGKVGLSDGKVTATGGLSRTTDVGKVSLDATVGDGKPKLNLGLTNDLRGGGQSSVNLNVQEGRVGGSLGVTTPLGNTGGTLSTEAGYSQDKGGFGQVKISIPF